MIRIQLVSREQENLQSLIRTAISEGRIKSFQISKVVGGLKITHKKHPGTIRISTTHGVVAAAISCTNPTKEWQLLEAFVGRVAYHFRSEAFAINIQFEKA
jgi:hypothetical protein